MEVEDGLGNSLKGSDTEITRAPLALTGQAIDRAWLFLIVH